MPHYTYLIVGGGMTAASALDGIREKDRSGSVGIISAETDPPYDRPPLSKGLWKGERLGSIWRKVPKKKLTLHLGRRVTELFPKKNRAVDDHGDVYTYGRLLLATGGAPRRLPFGGDGIIYYRDVADYQRLRALAGMGRRFAVIGAGFIGSEVAAGLALNKKDVTLIFPGTDVGGRLFPRDLAKFVSGYYKKKGVRVMPGAKVLGLEVRGDAKVLKTSKGDVVADVVVAGLGLEPNTSLAESAGVHCENGILVDKYLRTNVAGIYAAGDVAAFYNPDLGKRMRVEHEDNANTMGRIAGRNMAGASEPYDHLPFFYSDLFDLGYEAVGDVDSRLETFADWTKPNREGVVYYLDQGRVRGVLLWNVWEQVDAARALIAEPGPLTPKSLKGRLPVETS